MEVEREVRVADADLSTSTSRRAGETLGTWEQAVQGEWAENLEGTRGQNLNLSRGGEQSTHNSIHLRWVISQVPYL